MDSPTKVGSQFEGGLNSKCHWLWKYIECAINFKVLISPQRKLERLWGQAEKKVGVQGERAVFVRMGDLFPHHALRTKESLKKTAARAADIRAQKEEILQQGLLTFQMQRSLAPSDIVITGVQDRYGNVILLEGNGRYYAIKEALGDVPDLRVEIRLIHFGQSQEVWSAMDAALRLSNLTPPTRSAAVQIADSVQD